jgi:hypothetical protein
LAGLKLEITGHGLNLYLSWRSDGFDVRQSRARGVGAVLIERGISTMLTDVFTLPAG